MKMPREHFPEYWQANCREATVYAILKYNMQLVLRKEKKMDALLEILEEIRPDLDFSAEKNLMGDKILSSLDVLEIVSEISEEFGIRLSAGEIRPENFNSAEAMWDMITRLQGK